MIIDKLYLSVEDTDKPLSRSHVLKLQERNLSTLTTTTEMQQGFANARERSLPYYNSS